MNKLITFFFIALLVAGCNNSNKYFTGTIEYAYSYTSESLNVDSLTNSRYAKGILRYDNENYQSKFIGRDTSVHYYSGKLNKSFSEVDSGNYACEDYGVTNDSVLAYKIYDAGEKILGYDCKVLEFQKRNSVVKYYVSNELKIAPATYKQHRAYNWDFYGEKSGGGLILKLEHQFKSFTLSGIATSLNKEDKNFKALEIDVSQLERACAKKN